MSFFDQAFRPDQVGDPPPSEYEPAPPGEYELTILSVEEKPNSKNTGTLLKIEHQIEGGEFHGFKVFDNLNVEHPNERAVAHARASLALICRAVGVAELRSPHDLTGKIYRAKLDVEPGRGGYGPKNKIVERHPAAGTTGQAGGNPEENLDDEPAF